MTIGKGRIAPPLRLLDVQPLTREDLETLREKRHNVAGLERIRDAHHNIFRLLALGLSQKEVAEITGYSVTRVSQMEASPSGQELLALYRNKVNDKFEDAAAEMIRARTILHHKAICHQIEHFERAEEQGDLVPLKLAIAVGAEQADRLGPVKKSVSANVSGSPAEFAAAMEKAAARSSRVLDITPVGSVASAPTPAPAVERQVSAPAGAVPRRRIA